jgi:AcrR family transcriptional regulator
MGRTAFVRDRILEAAFDLIASEGYEAVSTRQIAAAAEVGSASMFKHFPTMEALGRELYRVALAPLHTEVAALTDDLAGRDLVTALVAWLCRTYDTRPRALALLVFPPHAFTPWEVDRTNPDAVRCRIQRALGLDDDAEAVLWGALTGAIEDRYLRRRTGAMSPHAATLAARINRLIPE